MYTTSTRICINKKDEFQLDQMPHKQGARSGVVNLKTPNDRLVSWRDGYKHRHLSVVFINNVIKWRQGVAIIINGFHIISELLKVLNSS